MWRPLSERIKRLQDEIARKEAFIKQLSTRIYIYKGRLERMSAKTQKAEKTTA